MNETMNICLISDNNFVNYLSALIVSVLKNSNDEDKFHFHIIEVDITNENKLKIMQLKEIKNCEISFYKSTNIEKYKNISDTIKSKHTWHYSVFFKLDIPFLFKDLDKILLIDADSIILDNLYNVYNFDISNLYCIPQIFVAKLPEDLKKWLNSIGIKDPNNEYLTSGVLLFNLKKIREEIGLENIEKLIDECVNKYSDIIYTEEHILYFLFKEKIQFMDFGVDTYVKNADKNRKIKIVTFYFAGANNKPLNNNYACRINLYYNKFWEYFTLTPFFLDNTFEYMNIFAMNKYKGIFYKLIDKIVWYIPIKKLRNKTRDKMINKVNSILNS
ncbi:glycosyltransferase [Brachyspira sp.]|uniref:glycosyltransferase family 8 protein n=1 Tax=Brachyspira sp. TaxID=1977261 RepID=UPI002629EEA9|nr:glycosyltransferase [Brachyspira sp.]